MNIRNTLRVGAVADLYRYLRESRYVLKVKRKTPQGFYFVGNTKMSSGQFENDIVMFLQRHVNKNFEIFIDVGAHHGFFSCLANSLGLKTISIEPDPMNFRVLKRNLKLNGYDSSSAINMGASDTNQTVEFHGFSTGVSVYSNWSGNVSRRVFRCEVDLIDNILHSSVKDQPVIIKIDVEGHEEQVIRGASSTLKRNAPTWVICEISFKKNDIIETKHHGKSLRVIELMRELGFTPFCASEDGIAKEFSLEGTESEGLISANILFNNFVNN